MRGTRHSAITWVFVCAAIAATALAVAFAPLPVTLVVAGGCVAVILVRRYGLRHGVWYLILLTIPLKEPLSLDVHGTVSVYPVDVLLLLLCAGLLVQHGAREVWRRSRTLGPIIAIVLLSAAGLYGATNVFWGIAAIYRIAIQLATFLTALLLVRDADDARRSLVFVVLSLLAPVAYGFYQTTLPFGVPVPEWGAHATAYDHFGVPFFRIFSTMNHPLNFSHYLTTGIGLSLGMAVAARTLRARAALVSMAAVAAVCNLFTYSAGGLVGMFAALVTVVVIARSRKLLAVAVVVVIAIVLVSPPAMTAKIDRLLSGKSIATAARLVTYQQSAMILKDHPVLGVGWGGVWRAFRGDYRLSRANAVAFGAENYFLYRAVAMGLVGLLLYVIVLAYYVRNLKRIRQREPSDARLPLLRAGLVVATVAFFAQAQFIPAANISTNSVLWLMIALAERFNGWAGAAVLPELAPSASPVPAGSATGDGA